MRSIFFASLLPLTLASNVFAAADFQVTEIYAGLKGNDGTADWFEVTNVGDSVGDTGSLFYSDSAADPIESGQLSSFSLGAGESAVFLIKGDAADITEFESVWGTGSNVGVTAGGKNLSQGGDQVWLFDGNSAAANIVEAISFGDADAGDLHTMDVSIDNIVTASVIGVNGAYESVAFENDKFGTPDNLITLIGSPGSSSVSAVPVPAAAWLFGSALMALTGLRRARVK